VRVDDIVIGLLDAAPALVHQPAVVVAADASLLDESMGEVRAAVGAVALEQPETSALVFVEHEVLAQEANGLDGGVIELARAPDRPSSSWKDMTDESAADRDLTLGGVAAFPLGGCG